MTGNEVIHINVDPLSTIKNVKDEIYEKKRKIPPEWQSLTFDG